MRPTGLLEDTIFQDREIQTPVQSDNCKNFSKIMRYSNKACTNQKITMSLGLKEITCTQKTFLSRLLQWVLITIQLLIYMLVEKTIWLDFKSFAASRIGKVW